MNKSKVINGTPRLYIRIMELKDIEDARILHNEESTLFKLNDINHISEESQLAWFKKISISSTSKRYVARLRENDEFVGVFRIDNIDQINRSALVGADIVPHHRGNGYAKEIFKYFFDYLFNQRGLHRLSLVTLETNKIALSLYEKLGFKIEGKQREAIYRDGRLLDLICMSILDNEKN